MTSSLITVIALVVGIAWLGLVFVSAVRNRGKERIAPNLQPGMTDEVLETRRLESGQKAAIAFSAFLAISLPLYFLSEPARQEGFVTQFEEESIHRGEKLVTEFKCFDCHGPEGVGGAATYVEKRSGVTVSWTVPSLNDVLYRYDESELNFWITFGRGNTPMPAWGLAGGGPLNEAEVVDVVNYLRTIQVPQAEAVNKAPDPAVSELARLDNAEQTMADAILAQDQVVHSIMNAPDQAKMVAPLSEKATTILEGSTEGIDTDADGVSDSAEAELSALSKEALADFTVVDLIVMDPAVADAEKADQAVATLGEASTTNPIVQPNLVGVQGAITTGQVSPGGLSENSADQLDALATSARSGSINVPAGPYDTVESGDALVAALDAAAASEDAPPSVATLAADAKKAVEDGSDPDGDGLSTAAEATITSQVADASTKTIPPQIYEIALDPRNPASVGGVPDVTTAKAFVGSLKSITTSLEVTTKNQDKLLSNEQAGLEFLQNASRDNAFSIDIPGVAASMSVNTDMASRAVGLFNGYCARCHTAGFSAGLPFTKEAGSGGFGPALWDGRPIVQFGDLVEPATDDLLILFITRGSEAQKPYGLNGFGSGRMPAFGELLSLDDIQLLAAYLRAGNLDGKGQ